MKSTFMQDMMPFLLTTAYEAGKAILEVYSQSFDVEYKSDLSPLTRADRESHTIIVRNILTINEEIPIISEEGESISFDARKNMDYFCLVDPLDGTKEFVKRSGDFTVNIALVNRDRPVLGVIYAPQKDVFYFAIKDIGSYKLENSELLRARKEIAAYEEDTLENILSNSTKLHGSCVPEKPRDHITIVGSRSHSTREEGEFVNRVGSQFSRVSVTSIGSSLKFCLIAEGSADIYPRFGPTMEWDTAAGQVIVTEAGGSVFDMKSKKEMRYNKDELRNPSFIAFSSSRLATSFGFSVI